MNFNIVLTTNTVYNINGKQWSLSTIKDKLAAIAAAGNATTHRICRNLEVKGLDLLSVMLVSYDLAYAETTRDLQDIGAVVLNRTNQIDQDMVTLFRQAVMKYEQITGQAVPGYSTSARATIVQIIDSGNVHFVVADERTDIFEPRNVHPRSTPRGGYAGATRGGRGGHIDSRDNRNVDNNVRAPQRGSGSHYYDTN